MTTQQPVELVQADPEGALPSGPAEDSPPLLAVLLLAFGTMLAIFLLLRHQYLKRPRAQASRGETRTPEERIEEIRRRASASEPLQVLKVEAAELAQELAARLDSKAERLEQLLAETDAKLTELEARHQALRSASPQVEERGNGSAARKPGGPDPAPPPTPEPEQPADPFVARVYELSDEGLGPVEIARKLDQQVGKVELILALRRA